MKLKRSNHQESLVYLVLWGTLFTAPAIVLAVHAHTSGETFQWMDVLRIWREYAIYLLLFLVHNIFLAPLLVYRQRRAPYFIGIAAVALLFMVYQCSQRPMEDLHGPHPDHMADRPPFPDEHRHAMPTFPPTDSRHGEPTDEHHEAHPSDHRPPIIFGQHDIIALIVLILMLGMNVGVKLYFKQRRDQKQLAQMEKQNLEQQLQYLKYQINPHFLMNTLNNIHALVDIDQEKAKQTIVELSKIMRFVLYEGSKQTVPLGRETDFLRDYIQLMSLRYTDRVRIAVDIPQNLPDSEIPPLMFITFVENAFKHGVSYRQSSFVEVCINIGEAEDTTPKHLTFTCRNSKLPKADDQHGGVGLQNVKQRLELIYGEKYTLDITDTANVYTVQLTLPL